MSNYIVKSSINIDTVIKPFNFSRQEELIKDKETFLKENPIAEEPLKVVEVSNGNETKIEEVSSEVSVSKPKTRSKRKKVGVE